MPSSGIDASSASVYGCCGVAKVSFTGPRSTILPAYITATSSTISATTPRSWVIRRIAMPSCSRRSFISSRICACTVTSSAVVGSSAIRSFGLQLSAMPIITRWRMPPDIWCG